MDLTRWDTPETVRASRTGQAAGAPVWAAVRRVPACAQS